MNPKGLDRTTEWLVVWVCSFPKDVKDGIFDITENNLKQE